MQLSDVLNDIQGDLTPAGEGGEVELNLPEPEVPPEQVVDVSEVAVDDTPSISVDDVQALETYRTAAIYMRSFEQSKTVDRATAMEVFTMLPELNDPLTVAKLTTASSAHNQSLLMNKLKAYEITPESLAPTLNKVSSAICEAMKTCEEIEPLVETVCDKVRSELARVQNTAIVVFDRKQYHLTQTPLFELSRIDDRLIHFAPYEGRLVDLISKIIHSDIYCEDWEANQIHPSVNDLAQSLYRRLEALREARGFFEQITPKLKSYDRDAFTEMDFKSVVSNIDNINKTKKVFQTKPEMVQALIDYLQLLV